MTKSTQITHSESVFVFFVKCPIYVP